MYEKELLNTLVTLWKHPEMKREQIVTFRNRKLGFLVRHAYENVTYYRRLLDREGIKPAEIRTAEDLALIPITDEIDLKKCGAEEIVVRSVSPQDTLVSRITSGSSGSPFVVKRFPNEDHLLNMFRIRAEMQFGVRWKDKFACLATAVPGEKRRSKLARLREAFGIRRSYHVECLQPVESIRTILAQLNLDVIIGYAGAVANAAQSVELSFKGKRLRCVICGGESLTPVKRRIIKNGFGSRVFDIYGAHECKIVDWECPRSGLYHICDDNVIVEIVKDGRPAREGEKGEVIITALHSYAMPFIRYRIGDVVTKGPDVCTCGQPFSTFEKIEGRVREYLLLPDGRWVHPLEVILPIITDNTPWLSQFQMVQETKTSFVLRLATLQPPTDQELAQIGDMASAKIGKSADFRIELTEQIAFEASGKFKDCRSLIRRDGEEA